MIRQFLLGSASALAFAAPLSAQTTPEPQVQGSGLDTTVPEDDTGPVAAPVPKTGDAVLDRLNEPEAKLNVLGARNRQLESEAAETATRVQKVEVRAAKGVQPGV